MGMIGFIGLGIMGKPMALNLKNAGIDLMVFDINEAVIHEFNILGIKNGSLQKIGESCEIIFTVLPDGAIVKNVLFGENGISSTLKSGSVVCDLSSVTPAESQFCSKKLATLHVGFIDAPVSGGEPKAKDGTLAFMAGGNASDFDKLLPYFNIMGNSALLVGASGSGSIAKLANQVIVNMTIAAVSEAFVLVAKSGVNPEKVYQAIRGGLAGSAVLDAKIPMILERNFVPGGKISTNQKDIHNVLTTAHTIDVPMPLTSQLFEILQALKVGGHMNDDHGGIIQYFEELAKCQVQRKSD